MTIRQSILKWLYPLIMKVSGKAGGARNSANSNKVIPPQSFYNLSVQLNNGQPFAFENLRGKKVLLVNTASNCGFTGQYNELQQLYHSYKEQVTVIGFPANDFKEQEKGSDEDIAKFCAVNFGVSFPLAKKTSVVKNGDQHPVYQWLTDSRLNGWNDKAPEWNFSKYLINEKGVLTHYFQPGTSPLDPAVRAAIEANTD